MTSSTTVQIPGYVVGTWDIDAAHSTVGFSVRHMMVSKVRGYFRDFSGEIVTAEDPAQSSVTATVDMASIDTRQEQRDAHIRSADFFDVGNHTEMTFRSTAVRTDGADWTVEGDLTIKGITKPVTLELELNGFGPDAYGGFRAGFSAKTEISRKELRRRHRHADGRRRRRRRRQDHRRARDRGRAPHRLIPPVRTIFEGPGRSARGPRGVRARTHSELPAASPELPGPTARP